MNRLFSAIIGAVALTMAATALAQAQSVTFNIGNAYAGATAGLIIPDDLDASLSGLVTGSGHYSFRTGPAFSGLIGYRFNNYIAAEGEIGVASADIDHFDGTINGASVSAAVDGNVTTVTVLANAIFTPLGRSGFSPYVGGGLGFASFDERVTAVGGLAVSSENTDTDFAADFVLGFDYPISGQWSVGGRYRLLWINTAGTVPSGQIATSQGDFTAHTLLATGTYHF